MYKIETIKNGISGCGAYDTSDSTINTESFDDIKSARKYIRTQIKVNGFERHAGYITNYSEGLTLHTNF
jgi:hypothetical protein